MKRFFCFLMILSLFIGTTALGEDIDLSELTPAQLAELQIRIQEEMDSRPEDHALLIAQALEVLKAGWKKTYDQQAKSGITFYLDIRGVRVIKLKDNLNEKAEKVFGSTKYIVDFLFYDDTYSCYSSFSGHNVGYLDLTAQKSCVLIDKQNNMTLSQNTIQSYFKMTYESDYSTFIEEVTDYRDQYNQIIAFSY